ncbi:MAG: hypothetical protein GWN00_33630, partial [Aliifodinibius sp.]|nr:hypothetical protein [Fodinibius sp.]NIY29551.1 hypothetical protein [Fodinibius sp.]
LYKDGDKIIQIRYRVRVIKGLGDDWENLDPDSNQYLRYSGSGYVKVKGSAVSIASDTGVADSVGIYTAETTTWHDTSFTDKGVFKASQGYGFVPTSKAHN